MLSRAAFRLDREVELYMLRYAIHCRARCTIFPFDLTIKLNAILEHLPFRIGIPKIIQFDLMVKSNWIITLTFLISRMSLLTRHTPIRLDRQVELVYGDTIPHLEA